MSYIFSKVHILWDSAQKQFVNSCYRIITVTNLVEPECNFNTTLILFNLFIYFYPEVYTSIILILFHIEIDSLLKKMNFWKLIILIRSIVSHCCARFLYIHICGLILIAKMSIIACFCITVILFALHVPSLGISSSAWRPIRDACALLILTWWRRPQSRGPWSDSGPARNGLLSGVPYVTLLCVHRKPSIKVT